MTSSIFGDQFNMMFPKTTSINFSKKKLSQQMVNKSAKADDDRFIFDWAI
jgi:hypothetical protein